MYFEWYFEWFIVFYVIRSDSCNYSTIKGLRALRARVRELLMRKTEHMWSRQSILIEKLDNHSAESYRWNCDCCGNDHFEHGNRVLILICT